jgi:hypothetical protein
MNELFETKILYSEDDIKDMFHSDYLKGVIIKIYRKENKNYVYLVQKEFSSDARNLYASECYEFILDVFQNNLELVEDENQEKLF